MLFYTTGQSYVFLLMLLAGLVCGAWYDILRRTRALTAAGRWLTALFDLLFALGCAPIAAGALYISNGADMRLYALLGMACGFVMYAFSVARAIDALFAFAYKNWRKLRNINILKKIFQFLCK